MAAMIGNSHVARFHSELSLKASGRVGKDFVPQIAQRVDPAAGLIKLNRDNEPQGLGAGMERPLRIGGFERPVGRIGKIKAELPNTVPDHDPVVRLVAEHHQAVREISQILAREGRPLPLGINTPHLKAQGQQDHRKTPHKSLPRQGGARHDARIRDTRPI